MLVLQAEAPEATSKGLFGRKIAKGRSSGSVFVESLNGFARLCNSAKEKGNGGHGNGTRCQFDEVTLFVASKTRDHTVWCAEQHFRLLQLIKALFKSIQRPEPHKICSLQMEKM